MVNWTLFLPVSVKAQKAKNKTINASSSRILKHGL